MSLAAYLLNNLVVGSTFSNTIENEDLNICAFNLIACLIHNKDIYFHNTKATETTFTVEFDGNLDELIELIETSKTLFHFQTSGTTGTPKPVTQSAHSLIKSVVKTQRTNAVTWGFCYSTRHISGILTLLQALLTNSNLVDIRNFSPSDLANKIKNKGVTHISAPSTFFRMNFPLPEQISNVQSVTNGGEPFDNDLLKKITWSLPGARIRNIYASTEFGPLLVSNEASFTIPEKLKNIVRIQNGTLQVHKSRLAQNIYDTLDGDWYETNDRIEFVDGQRFNIIGRLTEDVKVLGHLVSLRKVEAVANNIEAVKISRISSKAHKVFGNLLTLEIVLDAPGSVEKSDISNMLKMRLRDYEVPSRIKFVEDISMTSSGKMSRV